LIFFHGDDDDDDDDDDNGTNGIYFSRWEVNNNNNNLRGPNLITLTVTLALVSNGWHPLGKNRTGEA